jgi:O-antigen/teichoic acid export membrane protein
LEQKISTAFDSIGALLRTRIAAVRHIWKALSVSFVNQAVSSGTNFLLAVFFVRFMDTEAFGVYGIAIAVVLLFSGVGNALLLTQMVVHLPDKDAEERPAYFGRNLIMVSGLALLALALAAIAAGVQWLWLDQTRAAAVMLATGVAAAAYLVKDYFLRLAYSLRREGVALSMNIAVAIMTISSLAFVWWIRHALDATSAIAIYSAGQSAGVLVGLLTCWPEIRLKHSGSLQADLRQSLDGGRWALGGVLVTWLQAQAYVYMTAIFVGPVGVGYANAARVFVSPLQMIMPAINQVTMPRLASLRREGVARVTAAGRVVTGFALLLGFAYAFVLGISYPLVANLLLGDKYHGLAALVAAWCVVVLMQLLRDGGSTLLLTLRKFRRLTVSGTAVACLSVPVTAVLAKECGSIGAVSATAIAEFSLAVVLWLWIKRHGK